LSSVWGSVQNTRDDGVRPTRKTHRVLLARLHNGLGRSAPRGVGDAAGIGTSTTAVTTTRHWCRVRGCAEPGPFLSAGALGSHRRRRHGIIGIIYRRHRPDGGVLECKHACGAKPYVSEGGRSYHYRVKHEESTTNSESIRRRESRARARAQAVSPDWIKALVATAEPPPPSLVTQSHETKRTELDAAMRAGLEMLLARALHHWSGWLLASPDDVRAESLASLEANLRERRRTGRAAVVATFSPAQRENLRRRLIFVVNRDWARAIDATPTAVRDGLIVLLRESSDQLEQPVRSNVRA